MTEPAYDTLLVETRGAVGLITLNRPKALNALNAQVIGELARAFEAMEADEAVGAVVVTGSEKAFAAGADIKEMAAKTYAEAFLEDFTPVWRRLVACRKPSIAAVSGYALGGGCELAMMCDMIFAADSAKFGQPEITLGIIPGFGGTQRLAKAVGKAKAMDLILTGRMMDAAEAERCGLVARVVPAERLLDEALEAAAKIAGFSRLATLAAKEAVDVASEASLAEGVRFERRLFQGLFATEDQKEGMAAFVEKRKPAFRNR
ncbi:enoyl-CoA hydratase [Methylopila jiangsuensis]|uniref:enoyl-CoA hydratase n=1 Tax=Methylopila jiangsuensis TaxID=586230 RepID=A0A9W6JCH6_9HYPH|nr:enoyl-CoA hydratase [Methylopila jiangsuensis]MDR6287405.1 enoyl-CoA hydratase [Methylopila jiangsuensis]GLK74986.1 enoyl-CoA hydratase [Methylopila jiangsuensis]